MHRKIYLIYSPCVEDQLQCISEHPLLAEKSIQLRCVKLAHLPSIHIDAALDHALLWIEQKDYPQILSFAGQKKISLGFLPVKGDTPCQFFNNLDLPGDFDACLEIALHEDPLDIDLILCNGEVVTNGVNLEN